MAAIDKKTVEYLSRLARIACSDEEAESLCNDLKKIVAYVEQLNEIITENVEPCTYVNQSLTQAPLRKDIAENRLPQKKFLDGTPQNTAQMVRVPPVLKPE